jgi:hypothetical protein
LNSFKYFEMHISSTIVIWTRLSWMSQSRFLFFLQNVKKCNWFIILIFPTLRRRHKYKAKHDLFLDGKFCFLLNKPFLFVVFWILSFGGVVETLRVQTHRTRFDNATRFFDFRWPITLILVQIFQIFRSAITFWLIWSTYLLKFALIGCFINFQKLKNRVALSNRVQCVWTSHRTRDANFQFFKTTKTVNG